MTRPDTRTEVYKRKDGLWAWRALAGNNKVIFDDANQGFENKADAIDMASRFGEVTVLPETTA